MASSSHLTTRGKRTPVLPELDGVTPNEWTSIYMAATELAYRVLGKKDDAFEAVHEGYIALTSTHRYNPQRHKSLREHFLNVVRIECRNLLTYAEREDDARADLEIETGGDALAYEQHARSPETLMIAREEAEARAAKLEELRSRLRTLHRCVKHSPAAVALLEYWSLHGDDRPIPRIATAIGHPVDDVYEAKKLIERKAQTILRDEEEGDDE